MRINEFWAFVAEDQGPNDEGLVAFNAGDITMPMVGADMARIDSIRPIAEFIAKTTGKKIKLIKFSQREELEVIEF